MKLAVAFFCLVVCAGVLSIHSMEKSLEENTATRVRAALSRAHEDENKYSSKRMVISDDNYESQFFKHHDQQRLFIEEADKYLYGFAVEQNPALAETYYEKALKICRGANNYSAYAARKLEELTATAAENGVRSSISPGSKQTTSGFAEGFFFRMLAVIKNRRPTENVGEVAELTALLEKGICYEQGEKPRYLEALKCYEKVAQRKQHKLLCAWASIRSAVFYAKGFPEIPKDTKRACLFLCNAQQLNACLYANFCAVALLGNVSYEKGDYELAAHCSHKIIALKNAQFMGDLAICRAYVIMGLLYLRGLHFKMDLEKAKKYFELALTHTQEEQCDEEGKALAEASLGEIYCRGNELNAPKAVRLLLGAVMQDYSLDARFQAGCFLLTIEKLIGAEGICLAAMLP